MISVKRLGITDTYKVDEWFDNAMRDETVRPYLSTGTHMPRIEIPEDGYDGAVFMTDDGLGLLKVYPREENQSAGFGIWVLTPEDGSRRRARSVPLMRAGINYCHQFPKIIYMSSRVMSSNKHGINFSNRLLQWWGTETKSVYDTDSNSETYQQWVDWHHFKGPISPIPSILDVMEV